MQLTNTPGKLVLPFANAGAKNTIPTASQIGITAGAASLTDGFPPLTRTPIAAGGVPPSGLDMNGILYELSAILRWANAGGGYAYDAAFATDSNVGGYPKGARIMRSDGLGYWFNTVENNTTDPEAAGAAAAGWVPDFTNGVTSVAMASANVTLTPLQYGKPIIVITGTLTANLNLIFPAIVNEWTVINITTGPYTITCKTAAGTGLVVNTAALIVGDGTNIQSAVTDAAALFGETVATATGGTADAITATFSPVPRYASNGVPLSVRATAANATTTPTFTPNSGVIAAATIVKGNNLPLVAGDIAGAGHWLELAWDSTLSKWVLLNPANGINSVNTKQIQTLTASVAANALTVTYGGGTLDFRNATLTNGTPVASVSVPSNSITVPSSATLGTLSGKAARLIFLEAYNGGSPVLCVVNQIGGVTLNEGGLISPTTISAAATAANVIYSASAVSANSPFRVVGYVDITEATAGTWATAPTVVQGVGGRALQVLPVQGAKAWVTFDGTLTGTITPAANYNVGSVTKNGTGDYTLNFTTAMADANYAVSFGMKTGSQYDFRPVISNAATPTTTSCRVVNANTTGVDFLAQDPNIFCVNINGN